MRLSDILKKHSQQVQPDKKSFPIPSDRENDFSHSKKDDTPPVPRPPVFKKEISPVPSEVKPSDFSSTKNESSRHPVLPDEAVTQSIIQSEDVSDIYADAVNEARGVFNAVSVSKKFPLPVSVNIISDLILGGRMDFVLLTNRTTADHYIYSHVVNVTTFAALIAIKMGFSDEDVKKISAAAFLHDIGMAGMLDMVSSRGKLNTQEMARIRQHPSLGQNMVDEFFSVSDQDLKKFISQTILQIHERSAGQGYPRGLRSDNISESAMIIAVADSYEAMTHNRTYREQLIPHEAVKTLINEVENNYNQEVMKAFLEGFSLYPVGSYVRLSSNQIARVLRVNENMPTRPVVRLVLDQHGKKISTREEVDLEQTGILAIKEAVDETKLKIDPKLSLELQTQRWWIR